MEKEYEVLQGPLLGDKVIRPKRKRKVTGLRRVLGVPALYSMAYGDVGSSIYYALGITAVIALGATPIALGIAGVFFIFTALTYAEGVSALPSSGGSASFARRGFNELMGFLAGWSLILVYIATISISALSASFYFSYFISELKSSPLLGAFFAGGIIVFLTILNIIGVRETAKFNIFLCIFDLLTQAILVIVGFLFLFNLKKILGYINWAGSDTWPTLSMLPYAVCIGMVGYMGIETAAQMGDETRHPERSTPRALMLTVLTVLVMFISIPLIALSAMTPQELNTTWHENPIVGIAHYLPNLNIVRGEHFSLSLSLSKIMTPWIAVIATTILIIACNAALTAASRVAFYMSEHKQIPQIICKVHQRFRTPYIGLIFFSLVAILILVFASSHHKILLVLGDLYRFAGMLAFSIAHLSIIALRIKEPNLPRPFRAKPNINIGKHNIPLTAIIGFLSTFAVWLVVIIYNPWGRGIGFLWVGAGILMYIIFRVKHKLSIL